MSFHLVDTGWDAVFRDAILSDRSGVRIVCPFIKRRTAERLLKHGRPQTLQVITRFHLNDFCNGVSDLAALHVLLRNGAEIRGVRNLHAKLYLFGGSRAIVTSANLTEAALLRNHEFGFVAEDAGVVSQCRLYFDDLWRRAAPNLTVDRLKSWEVKVSDYLASGARPTAATGLGDEGVDAGVAPEPVRLPAFVGETRRAFVKFFGSSSNRASRAMTVLEEVQRSGSHWACTYPKGKRPRQVEDGTLMFIGRMVRSPNDVLIYGRAVDPR